jgi:hypothetical protein
MARHASTAVLILLSLATASPATAQATSAETPMAAGAQMPSAAADPLNVSKIACVGARETEIILSRAGSIRITLAPNPNLCGDESYPPPDILSVHSPSGAFVKAQDCTAFRTQIRKLQPRATHLVYTLSRPPVRAGPFAITDWADYFHLESPKERRMAARWTIQTLAAVRPCWKFADEDQGPKVLKSLYADLGMKPK